LNIHQDNKTCLSNNLFSSSYLDIPHIVDGEKIIVLGNESEILGLDFLSYLPNLGYSFFAVIDSSSARAELMSRGLHVSKDFRMKATMLDEQLLMGFNTELSLDSGDRTVCVMDSGINIEHYMFEEEQLLYWYDFIGSSVDESNDEYLDPCDYDGHGTFISSIIAGQQSEQNIVYRWIERSSNPLNIIKFPDVNTLPEDRINIRIDELIAQNAVSRYNKYRYSEEFPETIYIDNHITPEEVPYISNFIIPLNESDFGRVELYLDRDNGLGYSYVDIILNCSRYNEQHGVVPGANLVIMKVLDDNGLGTTSSFLEACEYLLHVKQRYNITVVNMSFSWFFEVEIVKKTVNKLCDEGLVVITPAGNDGLTLPISSPGTSEKAITVGSHNPFRELTRYSSRGSMYSEHIKPDILFSGGSDYCGLNVVGANSTYVDSLTSARGTSIAVAFASGIALAKTADMEWEYNWKTVSKIKQQILMSSFETEGFENIDYDYNWQIPQKNHFTKDLAEGWGTYYYQEHNTIEFDPVHQTSKQFFAKVKRNFTGSPVQIFQFHGYENYNYQLNYTSDQLVTIWVVSETPTSYGEPNFLGQSYSSQDTIEFSGKGEETYIVVRVEKYDTNISLELGYHNEPSFVVNKPKHDLIRIATSDIDIDIGFSNGIIELKLDGEDISEYRQSAGRYFVTGIPDGHHNLTILFSSYSHNETFFHEWESDDNPPSFYCSTLDGMEIKSTTELSFYFTDIHDLTYVFIRLNQVELVDTSLSNTSFSFNYTVDPNIYQNGSIIEFSLGAGDEFLHTARYSLSFIIINKSQLSNYIFLGVGIVGGVLFTSLIVWGVKTKFNFWRKLK